MCSISDPFLYLYAAQDSIPDPSSDHTAGGEATAAAIFDEEGMYVLRVVRTTSARIYQWGWECDQNCATFEAEEGGRDSRIKK